MKSFAFQKEYARSKFFLFGSMFYSVTLSFSFQICNKNKKDQTILMIPYLCYLLSNNEKRSSRYSKHTFKPLCVNPIK